MKSFIKKNLWLIGPFIPLILLFIFTLISFVLNALFGDNWITMGLLIPVGIALFLPAIMFDALGVEGLMSGLDVFNMPSTKGLWLSFFFWVLISAIIALINFRKRKK